MDISSRQIVALGAPLIVTYLTWSALGSQVKILNQVTAPAVGTAAAAKRPEIGPLARNPFEPAAESGVAQDLAALVGEDAGGGEPSGAAALHLDGTAIAGKWRMAIINGERVFEGQAYRGHYRLSEVGTDGVTLLAPSGETLRLSLDIARADPAAAARAAAGRAKAPGGAAAAATSAATAQGTGGTGGTAATRNAPLAAALERGLAALKGEVEAGLVAESNPAPASK